MGVSPVTLGTVPDFWGAVVVGGAGGLATEGKAATGDGMRTVGADAVGATPTGTRGTTGPVTTGPATTGGPPAGGEGEGEGAGEGEGEGAGAGRGGALGSTTWLPVPLSKVTVVPSGLTSLASREVGLSIQTLPSWTTISI